MLALMCAIAPALSAPHHPRAVTKVGSVTLEDLVRYSDLVVVGSVERLRTIQHKQRTEGEDTFDRLPDEVPIAEVRIARVLKGPAQLGWVNYVATRTWTCDITTAELGESALLFFGDASRNTLFDEDLRRDIHTLLPRGDLSELMWSGRGRMLLAEGKVTYWDEVVMPKDCPDVDGPEPESPFIRSVSVEWLSDRIQRIAAGQKGKLWFRASVLNANAGAFPWDLEVSMDRESSLVVHQPGGDRLQHFTANWRTALGLLREPEFANRSPAPTTIGTGHEPLGDRRLEAVGETAATDVRILSIDSNWMSEPARSEATRAWLRMWGELRALIDDPACADHRTSDAKWLDRTSRSPSLRSPQVVSLVVIGGTILGLAIAHVIRKRLPGQRVVVSSGESP